MPQQNNDQTAQAERSEQQRTPKSRSPLIGRCLNGRYRIEDVIGTGGMSAVYLAFDETLERSVAVKVLDSSLAGDPSGLERFRREARSVAQISHPHVVMVIDAGEDEGHPYIVFEYVRGETLKDRIRRIGPLPVSEAVAYAIEIGRALEAAHERQLVHRDVKPQNVLIDEEGRAKVTDFGIARSLDLTANQLTAAGRVVGTTDYVSPEQALGNEVSGVSDVYSLGIVLYEMLTGDVPFKGESPVSVAMKHVQEGLPDVQRRRPEVSAALAAVLERATCKEPANRYSSAQQLVRQLEEVLAYEAARTGSTEGEATTVLEQLPAELKRRGPGPRGWRRLGTFLLAGLALAVGAGLVIESARDGDQGVQVDRSLSTLQLGERDAIDYDPPPGDGGELSTEVPLTLDGDRTTAWHTENYDTPDFGNIKDGVGVYLDAGRPLHAKTIRITTDQEGWEHELYVANSVPDSVARWTKVGGGTMDAAGRTFDLDTGGQRFRYYLVWITKLAKNDEGRFSAGISELRLQG